MTKYMGFGLNDVPSELMGLRGHPQGVSLSEGWQSPESPNTPFN